MKRGASGISGIIAIDKPSGITSHDVVNRVRAVCGERRVGHAGTLDPAATGLLVVCVGPATRLSPYLIGHDKHYDARISFGTRTTTDDGEGEVILEAPVPDEVFDPIGAATYVEALCGEFEQLPPAYSAIKQEGRKAYEVARSGGTMDLSLRTVRIYAAALRAVGDESPQPYWDISIKVSKGTYVRSIARDIGESYGSAAHLSRLRRTRSGVLDVSQAISLEELVERGATDLPFCDPVVALGLPRIEVGEDVVDSITSGKHIPVPAVFMTIPAGPVAVTHEGLLLSVSRLADGFLTPMSVIPGGVVGCSPA